LNEKPGVVLMPWACQLVDNVQPQAAQASAFGLAVRAGTANIRMAESRTPDRSRLKFLLA
jgi:hypothetical protein